MEEEMILGLVAIVSLFVLLPGMIFHYITQWRKQKSLMPDDERMLEDLWRSAKRMERRIETLESLINSEGGASNRPTDDDFTRRFDQ
ncbi:MAG: envelope stress response membrane protein PspB [Pseudomonadota bacterium]